MYGYGQPKGKERPCVAEPEATFPSSAVPCALRSPIRLFCSPFFPTEYSRLPQTSLRLLPLAQTTLPIPCESVFLNLTWIFSFTFSIFSSLCIPFLLSGRHFLLFPSIRWESPRLSCFLPTYLSHLLRIKAFLMHHSIPLTLFSGV